jgi:hypothetical protein
MLKFYSNNGDLASEDIFVLSSLSLQLNVCEVQSVDVKKCARDSGP